MSKKLEGGPSESEGQVDRRNLLKGAAAVGLGVLGARAASAQECPPEEPTVQNLVVKMAEDPEFARRVIAEPHVYKAQYNLSRRAVESLRGLRIEDFEHIRVSDPRAFAMGAMTAATMARHDFAEATAECGGGDTCYYFG